MSSVINLFPSTEPITLGRFPNFRVVSQQVGAGGEIIELFAAEPNVGVVFGKIEQPGWASFPRTHVENPYVAKVCVTTKSNSEFYDLPSVTATYPMVQRMPDNKLLVVAPRCRLGSLGPELNAKIYRHDGSLDAEFCLGDGIEDVQTDKFGRIWVSYFDEGVYGNFGWGTEGEVPSGAAGLVQFDGSGKKQWEFAPTEGFDYISDCYSLNVSADSVWVCYYTGFPIVQIDAACDIRSWRTDLSGTRALATYGGYVLAYGGYSENSTSCQLLQLNENDAEAELVAEVKLHVPMEGNLGNCTVVGRGEKLYVFSSEKCYSFRVPATGEQADSLY